MTVFRFFSMILSVLVLYSASAQSDQLIHKETDQYVLEIKYPESLPTQEMNEVISSAVKTEQEAFLKNLPGKVGMLKQLPGKNQLKITYKILFQQKAAMSVKMTFMRAYKGVAHPDTRVQTYNFLNGKAILLQELFKNKTKYLETFSHYAERKLLENKDADEQWVKKGTAPNVSQFQVWYFSNKGLGIIFPVDQVAPFSDGPQTVMVPLAVFENQLKSGLKAKIWETSMDT